MPMKLTKSGENPEPQMRLPIIARNDDDAEQRSILTHILRLDPPVDSDKEKKTTNPHDNPNVGAVRRYLHALFSGNAAHSDIREWLTDDFTFSDPLMSATSADDYVNQLKASGGNLKLEVDIHGIVGEGDLVGALIDFPGPTGLIPYSLWFTFRDGKLSRLQAIYDPSAILKQRARMI